MATTDKGLLGANVTLDPPGVMARIGRGMTDLYEPIYSYLLGHPMPGSGADINDPSYAQAQQQYDAQRKTDEAIYLRGLLGTAIPEQLRGAVPDIWRAAGQALPFFALGPMGGLESLTGRGIAGAAANTLGYAAVAQPAMYTPELWDYFTQLSKQFGIGE